MMTDLVLKPLGILSIPRRDKLPSGLLAGAKWKAPDKATVILNPKA